MVVGPVVTETETRPTVRRGSPFDGIVGFFIEARGTSDRGDRVRAEEGEKGVTEGIGDTSHLTLVHPDVPSTGF